MSNKYLKIILPAIGAELNLCFSSALSYYTKTNISFEPFSAAISERAECFQIASRYLFFHNGSLYMFLIFILKVKDKNYLFLMFTTTSSGLL